MPYKFDVLHYHCIKEPALLEHIDRAWELFYENTKHQGVAGEDLSEWKKTILGDILNLRRGHDLPKQKRKEGNVPIISSSGITGYHSEYQAIGPGVVTGRYGTIGQVFFVRGPYWPLNTTLYVDDFKENDPLFVLYFLKSINFDKYSDKSTVPGINRNHLHLEEISIPPLPEQHAIASVLSSLDDKIDLLHRQNQTLEQMAETMFRQWFVEAEENWQELTLDDCVELIIDHRGKTPKKLGYDWTESGIAAISAKNVKNGELVRPETFKFVDDELYAKWMKDELQKGDILMTSEAPLGELYFLNSNRKYVLSQRLYGIRANSLTSPYYLHEYLKSPEGQNEILGRASGTTVFGIRQSELRKVAIPMPDKKIMNTFDDVVEPIYSKIECNSLQMQKLTSIRDTLLPKLMSGEIRIDLDE